VSAACVASRLFELCMRLRFREVNGKGSETSSQVVLAKHTRCRLLVQRRRGTAGIA
jgi:hypothetical protein